MSDPFVWPALAGAEVLVGEVLRCEIGIWGKVHGQTSDYRWIARSGGFGAQLPDLQRHLRLGAEDLPVRMTAWRAPWAAAGQDWFAICTYPSRALDATGRSGVLEKQVLHWRRPSQGFPAALAACLLLPQAVHADDRLWWERVGEGDWQRPDYALPLGADACPAVTLRRTRLESVIAAGIDELLAVLDRPRLAAVYASLLAGSRPVVVGGLERPLAAAALAALLLPLPPGLAERCSVSAWVPATLIDLQDLGRHWDLVVTRQPGARLPVAAQYEDRGAALAAALCDRNPRLLAADRSSPVTVIADHAADLVHAARSATEVPVTTTPAALVRPVRASTHPNPRLHLEPTAAAAWPGLGYLYEFADRINLRRLDLGRLALDLAAPAPYPLLAAGADPSGHPLVGWIEALDRKLPHGVDAAEWAFKIDQLRAATLLLLPHPATLDLVGLPRDPRVPALLAVLAADPGRVAHHLADHGEYALRRILGQSLACPTQSLVADIRHWIQRWLATTVNTGLARALGDLRL